MSRSGSGDRLRRGGSGDRPRRCGGSGDRLRRCGRKRSGGLPAPVLFLLLTAALSLLRCGWARGEMTGGGFGTAAFSGYLPRPESRYPLRSIAGNAMRDSNVPSDALSDILDRLDLKEAEDYALAGQDGSALSLTDVVRKLAAGDMTEIGRDMLAAVRSALFAEIGAGGRLLGQIMLLGILGAVFSNFSSVFSTGQISETGFYAVYLLLFTLLIAALGESMAVAAEAVRTILGFMRVLMPAYFLAVAYAGGTVSSVVMYESAMAGMTAGEWVLDSVMIPLVRVWMILTLAGNLTKENVFSRLTELTEQIINWGMKTLLGLVLGFQLLESMVLPYVDSLKNGAVQKLVGLIPGVGQGAVSAAQMLLGAGVLIKNSVGMAAVVVLAVMAAVPVVKLLVLMMLYQCAAAALEPVCDKRVLACVTAAAKGHKALLRIVFTAVMIFAATIAIVCAGTNGAYPA